jgi:hypothetical protein
MSGFDYQVSQTLCQKNTGAATGKTGKPDIHLALAMRRTFIFA